VTVLRELLVAVGTLALVYVPWLIAVNALEISNPWAMIGGGIFGALAAFTAGRALDWIRRRAK
jgi:hypothetical protein